MIARCQGRQIVRDVFAANGFMGQSPPDLILGVGEAEKIDQLEVRWPSGAVQTFADLDVDQDVTITEGQTEMQSVDWSDGSDP